MSEREVTGLGVLLAALERAKKSVISDEAVLVEKDREAEIARFELAERVRFVAQLEADIRVLNAHATSDP